MATKIAFCQFKFTFLLSTHLSALRNLDSLDLKDSSNHSEVQKTPERIEVFSNASSEISVVKKVTVCFSDHQPFKTFIFHI